MNTKSDFETDVEKRLGKQQSPKKRGEKICPRDPRDIVKELIGDADIKFVSRYLGMSDIELTDFLGGSIPLTARLALRLSRCFKGRSVHQWMKLQIDYDLHHAELELVRITSEKIINFAYLHPPHLRGKEGKSKIHSRGFFTKLITNQITENVNESRRGAGLPEWEAKDFERELHIGTGAYSDDHPGRQWKRMMEGHAVTEAKLRQLKREAERRGWLESTDVEITKDIEQNFLDDMSGYYLSHTINEAYLALCKILNITDNCNEFRLGGTDGLDSIDPEEELWDHDFCETSEIAIHELILGEIIRLNEIMKNLIARRRPWTER